MKEVGTVLHVAGSGRVIVRLTGAASEGDVLCNSRGRRIVRIREMIGPVSAPYASAESLTNNIDRYLGTPVGSIGRRKS
jgi:RNA-binding protein